MRFPDHIVGPRFEEGDLVTFTFDDSILTLRTPVVPKNKRAVDDIDSEVDFRSVDTTGWLHFGDQGHCVKTIISQSWDYEDENTHDDIAHVLLEVGVLRHSDQEVRAATLLSSDLFRSHFLREIESYHRDEGVDILPGWPSPENAFFARTIQRDLIHGLQVQLDLGGGEKTPVPRAYLSLGRRYSLGISFHFGSLHYPDRVNPYSEELLKRFRDDAFDDFLSHIHIEYTPNTVALIERLNSDPKSVSENELLGN